MPMQLITSDERKGYSLALIDAMRLSRAPYLLCLDADGQLDPKDFWRFWEVRNSRDVALGWRVRRADTRIRVLISRTFYHLYQCFYHVPVHDPSCPFLLIRRGVLEDLVNEMGSMKEGFWWEFVARVHRRGFSIRELPVNHRPRKAGTTQVYSPQKLPGIGCRHFVALFTVWHQTRGTRCRPVLFPRKMPRTMR